MTTNPLTQLEFDQFLTDVLTGAGLVAHGKQCKGLGARLGESVYRLRYNNQIIKSSNTKTTPYAWRNPVNGCIISNDKKQNLLSVGNGYPNFSEPLYLNQE